MQSLLSSVHPEWRPLLDEALHSMDQTYLHELIDRKDWLPGSARIFSAFSLPRKEVRYILFGESPYPRAVSANGYAFWDANVQSLWSEEGLSKQVNRATSLRNFMKMLLIARGDLTKNELSKERIRALDKTPYIKTGDDLFQGMLKRGFLLLNATPVYAPSELRRHAKEWRPFMKHLLSELSKDKEDIELLLFGKIAEAIPLTEKFNCLTAVHPYNLEFITDSNVLSFFKPLDLLKVNA